jgi:two-component system NtrC family sensor kinase
MKSFNDLSITTKLSLLVLFASGVALTLATACFVWNDLSMIRSSKVEQISTVAEVLGSNSTPHIKFEGDKEATELLTCLRRQPEVVFACIYNDKGIPFALYRNDNSEDVIPSTPPPVGTQFSENGLDVVHKIEENGQLIGTIYLHSNLDQIHEQIMRYVVIVAGMIVISLVISTFFASRFQRVISTPLLKLAETAMEISKERNYSIRVTKTANDEIGILYDQFNTMLEQIQTSETAIQQANDQLEMKIRQRTVELSLANEELSHEIKVRAEAERELETIQQKLVDSARRAGMAEIASGVLHNVGNVLNSINVSATLVADKMRQSKVTDLIRATDLIKQHTADFAKYVTEDPKGKHLPGFLVLVANHMSDERSFVVKEVELLATKIEHVKAIVATQQTYAGYSGVKESVDLAAVIQDAINFNLASFERHNIAVSKDCPESLRVSIDKQRVLQILINIVKNAKEAYQDMPADVPRTIKIRAGVTKKNTIQIAITDNGMGILAQNLTRIFSHGFTTKPKGHGFGLHSCANAANEMGGSLTVQSEGAGKGATFILEIPYQELKEPEKRGTVSLPPIDAKTTIATNTPITQ